MHEFEGLLFSDPERFAQNLGEPALAPMLRAIRERVLDSGGTSTILPTPRPVQTGHQPVPRLSEAPGRGLRHQAHRAPTPYGERARSSTRWIAKLEQREPRVNDLCAAREPSGPTPSRGPSTNRHPIIATRESIWAAQPSFAGRGRRGAALEPRGRGGQACRTRPGVSHHSSVSQCSHDMTICLAMATLADVKDLDVILPGQRRWRLLRRG